jgi:iron complex transport system ATP-binding protein
MGGAPMTEQGLVAASAARSPTTTDGPAIALRDISFRYAPGAPLALDGVSVQVREGAITALLGPNGSGKSTLLHLLLGLLPAEVGEVWLMGQRHAAYTRRELSQLIGLVPQDEHVTFELSVLEYALLGRAPHLGLLELPQPSDRELAREALQTAGIATLAQRAVTSLSGGEKQLATVARALTQEPRILLLDEPTSHLDLANARRILGVLRALCEAGKTIVLTTHDPNAAASVAHEVILLRNGQVLAAGPTSQVLTSGYLSATYGVPVEVAMVHGRPLVLPWVETQGC